MCISAIIAFFRKPHPTIYTMTGVDMLAKVQSAGLTNPFNVQDGVYYYSDMDGWKQVLPKLLTNKYVAELNDCEDLAMQAMLDSSVKYGLNAIGIAEGPTPIGPHAFCILYVKDRGFMLFEEQKGAGYGGVPFDVGDHGYQVDKILVKTPGNIA